MGVDRNTVNRFKALFSGFDSAYGTGEGGWKKEPPGYQEYKDHLEGKDKGLGIGPLRQDGTVTFGAIDLDEPDFETAKVLASLLPGETFIEKSRSGNAHVWSFFSSPAEAWIVRGIMREATAAVNRRQIEVFPKQDKLREGMLGSYINLPYHGDSRPMLVWDGEEEGRMALDYFLDLAEQTLNDPKDWVKRASWLGVPSPQERAESGHAEFGTQKYLHQCAEYVIANRDHNPVGEGHRAVVYFALCKQFSNCTQYSKEEALAMIGMVNEASPDPIDPREIERMYDNAVRGQFTSTSCDDPLFQPFADPDCPIAAGNRR